MTRGGNQRESNQICHCDNLHCTLNLESPVKNLAASWQLGTDSGQSAPSPNNSIRATQISDVVMNILWAVIKARPEQRGRGVCFSVFEAEGQALFFSPKGTEHHQHAPFTAVGDT